jgi:hypothetical protein
MAYNGDGRPVVQRDMSQELVVHTEFHLSEAYHTECEILFFSCRKLDTMEVWISET